MLTLLLGSDWVANRNEILRRVSEDVRAERGNRILMVPELISHDTERRLASVAGDTSSRFAQVLSFTRLGRRVMDIVGNAAMECLDNSGRIVAMAAAARQLHSRLKAYGSVETKPEFLAQLLDAVDEFKRCCISPDDLRNAMEETGGVLAQKLEELSLLLESYDALCSQGKRDPRDQMTWVLEQLEEIDFASRHVFYVDGFPDFTRQNMAILEHIISSGTEITVSLNCDKLRSENLAFEKAGHTAMQLYNYATRQDIPVRVHIVPPRCDALQPLRQSVFEGSVSFVPSLQSCVKAVKATTVYQECQVAAGQILSGVQNGYRYRDFGVVCTRVESYIPVLRLVFGKCGIPLYLAGTEEVLQSGVISTLIFALEAALSGLEQRDVLRYLRSTLSPLELDACDEIENYAVIWAVSGKAWTEHWTKHPAGLVDQWDESDHRQLERLNNFRCICIEPLAHLREHFREADNIGMQVQAIYDFLEEISFCQRLEELAQKMDADGDNRSAQICNQLWEILIDALEQMYDVLGATTWDNENFVRLLKLLLSQCDVGTIPPVLDSVSVGTVEAMRCQQQKHLIILGADEGSLPGYGGSSGLLTDQERVALRNAGVPLTGGAMEGLQAEFAEIYGVFCGAEESITVVSSDSQPSFIYRRIASLSGGEVQQDWRRTSLLRHPVAAASYLVRCDDVQAAKQLGIEAEYQYIQKRKEHSLGAVSKENIRALYGKKLRLSASQVDRQAECRLSYFLKYGLRAQERKEATVDPAEFGTYVHSVLEHTGRTVMEKGGFHAVGLEDVLSIAAKYSEEYLKNHFSALESHRMEYLFRRNVQELEMVVRELWRELNQSAYEPTRFELHFGDDGEMPYISIPNRGMEAVLRGFVDRVDIWQRGESTYFRVVDYKTGKKDFDYCDVFNGVGLQMLLYLFALEKAGGEVLSGKRISAGVQYFPARAPYVNVDGSMTEEEAYAARRKEWKRSGLLLSDEESLRAMDASEKLDTLSCKILKDGTLSGDVADHRQLGILSDYIMGYLGHLAEDIASGNVTPNPYTRGNSHNACTFCPYGSVCHQETVEGRRNYKSMSAQQFWEEIEKEVGTGG